MTLLDRIVLAILGHSVFPGITHGQNRSYTLSRVPRKSMAGNRNPGCDLTRHY